MQPALISESDAARLADLETKWQIDTRNRVQPWHRPEFDRAGISVFVLRGDENHPVLQGNKWHKLKAFLLRALAEGKRGFVSVGGAYSNHLQAVAWAAKALHLESLLYIRGSEAEWSENPAIHQLKQYGARVVAMPRSDFRRLHIDPAYRHAFLSPYAQFEWVPMGGSGPECLPYVADWAQKIGSHGHFDFVALPAATAGTASGFATGLLPSQTLLAVEVLRTNGGLEAEMRDVLQASGRLVSCNVCWLAPYHFGGYARVTDDLRQFCMEINGAERFQTEPVYSGKVFWAVSDLAQKGYFPERSRILIVHTGGLFPWTLP